MPITDIGLIKQYIIVSNKFINYLHILFDKPSFALLSQLTCLFQYEKSYKNIACFKYRIFEFDYFFTIIL